MYKISLEKGKCNLIFEWLWEFYTTINYIMNDNYTYLCTWTDSTVLRSGGKVLKLYKDLPVETVIEYHELQRYFSRLVQDELDGRLRMPPNCAWQGRRLNQVWVKIVPLTTDMVSAPKIDFSRAKFYKWDGSELSWFEPPPYISMSMIPNIWWEELHDHMHTPSGKSLLREVSWQMQELGMPVVGTDIYAQLLHPINIKVLPHKDWLDLIITDIGASIRATLNASQQNAIL